jgi:hypothetical protein
MLDHIAQFDGAWVASRLDMGKKNISFPEYALVAETAYDRRPLSSFGAFYEAMVAEVWLLRFALPAPAARWPLVHHGEDAGWAEVFSRSQ